MAARRQTASARLIAPMEVQSVPIGDVIPYARNPRKNDTAIAKVARSLQEFGWKQPIVVDRKMVVVVGHTRLLAARLLGAAAVPVIVAKDLTPAQCQAYRLADNRIGEEAEWDKRLLAIELDELRLQQFDMALTGFDGGELGKLRLDEESLGGDTKKKRQLSDKITFQVVIDCKSEVEQAALLRQFKAEGRNCRPLMV